MGVRYQLREARIVSVGDTILSEEGPLLVMKMKKEFGIHVDFTGRLIGSGKKVPCRFAYGALVGVAQ